MDKKLGKMVITLDSVNQAQAVALKKMFEYMEYLGGIGSSRMCSFYADGDGSSRPKVTIEYSEELPDIPEIDGILPSGDFAIDPDEIAWKIYH